MGGGKRGFRDSYASARYDLRQPNFQTKISEINFENPHSRVESEVNEYLRRLLINHNERDAETFNQRLNSIIEILKTDNAGVVNLKLGGSVSKHTYIDGISDTDLLALINNSSLSEFSPKEAIKLICSQLSSRLSRDCNISAGNLAITVKYRDGMEIQIIPALKKYSGFRIPDKNGNEWSSVIRPDKFASKLTEINQNLSGNVVRVIKLVKGINDLFSSETKLSGYHIESLAIEVFKKYPSDYPKTLKRMLKYFFEKAHDLVKKPICDKTNQSLHVDDYLGTDHSYQRIRIGSQLQIVYEKMEKADREGSSDQWKKIVEG